MFFEEAVNFPKKGDVILQGDINARIGSQTDFLPKDKYDDIFGIDNQEENPRETQKTRKYVKGALCSLIYADHMTFVSLMVGNRGTSLGNILPCNGTGVPLSTTS